MVSGMHRALATEAELWARRDALAREAAAACCQQGGCVEPERPICESEARCHIEQLAVAIGRDSPALFVDYVRWAAALEEAHRIGAWDPAALLEQIGRTVERNLGRDRAALVAPLTRRAIRALSSPPPDTTSHLPRDGPFAALAAQYLGRLLAKRGREAIELVRSAHESGVGVRDLYLQVFTPVQYELGRLWQLNRISVADEHYSTAATQLAMAQLYPALLSTPRIGRSMAAAAAAGELHELGLRMVADMFELEGWDTFYVGASAPRDAVLDLLREERPDLVALSATSAQNVRQVAGLIEALRDDPELRSTRVLVGGRPFLVDPRLHERLGADDTAPDAAEAVAVGSRLVAGR
jgi:methanogenic corrinoid protein MtbC1